MSKKKGQYVEGRLNEKRYRRLKRLSERIDKVKNILMGNFVEKEETSRLREGRMKEERYKRLKEIRHWTWRLNGGKRRRRQFVKEVRG